MKQVIVSGVGNALNSSATEYAAIYGRRQPAWNATLNNLRQMCAGNGVIHSLHIKLTAAPSGASGAFTFTLMQNGSATGLAVTITTPDTEAIDFGEVTVTAGDLLALRCVPSGTHGATVPFARWSWTFRSTDADDYAVLVSGHDNNLHASNTEKNFLPGGANWGSIFLVGSSGVAAEAPIGGTLRNHYVELSSALTTGQYTFKIRVGGTLGVNVAFTSATGTKNSNTTSTKTIVKGDDLQEEVAPRLSPNVRDAYWGCVFQTEDPYNNPYIAGSGDKPLYNGTTEYNYIYGCANWTATRLNRECLSRACVLHGLRLQMGDAIPSGGTATLTVTVNGVATALSAVLVGSGTFAQNTNDFVEINDGDLVVMQWDYSGTAPGFFIPTAKWGLLSRTEAPFPSSMAMGGYGI